MRFFCRGGRTRTGDLFDPNEARYQAAPHPERKRLYAGLGEVASGWATGVAVVGRQESPWLGDRSRSVVGSNKVGQRVPGVIQLSFAAAGRVCTGKEGHTVEVEKSAIANRRDDQRRFYLAGIARAAPGGCMGQPAHGRLLVADPQRCRLLPGRLGADVAVGLFVAADETNPAASPVSYRRHRLHGQQRLPVSGGRAFAGLHPAPTRGRRYEQ